MGDEKRLGKPDAKGSTGPSEQKSLSGIEKLVTESFSGIQKLRPQASATPQVSKPASDSSADSAGGSPTAANKE